MLNITEENFEKEVVKSEKMVLLDFWAEWCGPCKMMGPVFEELSKEIHEIKFAKVNTDDAPEIASEYGIQGIPALVLTKKGKEVDRIVGFAPKPALKAKIKEMISK